jgi:tungstate transport system ATP-binding protein
MSAPGIYCLEEVTKAYGGRSVLRIDRLEIEAGEVLCLVGPTGAGKSTLLRLLSGVEAPTSGVLRFGASPLATAAELDILRRVTLVFQRPLLLSATVRANVAYGLRFRSRRATAAPVQKWLDRLGLTALADRSARTLSGGETQLVALGRALVLEPEVLLLDEPTNNLDPARVALVEEVVAAEQRQRRITVVWATHNLFQTRRVAGRVALLLDGGLVETAATEVFFETPRDPRTAAFVRGEMIY